MVISSRTIKLVPRPQTVRRFLRSSQKRFRNDCEERDCCGRLKYPPYPPNYVIEKTCTKCNYFKQWKPRLPNLKDDFKKQRMQDECKNKPKECHPCMNNICRKKTRCEIEAEAAIRFKQNDPKSVAVPPPPPKFVPKAPNMHCSRKLAKPTVKKCLEPLPQPDWDTEGILY